MASDCLKVGLDGAFRWPKVGAEGYEKHQHSPMKRPPEGRPVVSKVRNGGGGLHRITPRCASRNFHFACPATGQYTTSCLRSRSILHSFQGQRPGRARDVFCRDQENKICQHFETNVQNTPTKWRFFLLRGGEPESVARLVGQLAAVSVETVRVVGEFSGLSVGWIWRREFVREFSRSYNPDLPAALVDFQNRWVVFCRG